VGLSFYTLGQRQGLGIGGVKDKGAQRGGGDHAPWFVAARTWRPTRWYAVQGHDHPWLLSRDWCLTMPRGHAGAAPADGAYAAKTRYRQQDAACALAAGDAPAFACALPSRNGPSRRARARCCTTARCAWAAA
jgi:tRNA-specific 2-thiouridylase